MAGIRAGVVFVLWCGLASAVTPASLQAQAAPSEDDETTPQPAQPDFVLVNLPTTLRLPEHKGGFRLTHRFQANLRNDTFGHQASNLFGLDNGAAIGFEYRFAVARHVQAAVYRTNIDKTLQLYGKYDPIKQSASMPVSVSALFSVEGRDNFQDNRVPAVGAIVSKALRDRTAFYVVPVWVHNSAGASGIMRDTGMLGLGGRVRLGSSMYVVAEVSPRLAGYKAGQSAYGVAIEGRAGGHVFQLNISNGVGTTIGQTAAGGFSQALYLGFNITRKFY